MAARTQLGVLEFGKQLIETGDLDPVYIILQGAGFTTPTLKKWLLSYLCFYHCGTASWLSSKNTAGYYWNAMGQAAASKQWPRGSERRHFRGQQAISAVQELRDRGLGPAALISELGHASEAPTLAIVMERVQQWRGFGPWIAFKAADMLERLGLVKVQFRPEDIFDMFDSPTEGAIEVWSKYSQSNSRPNQGEVMWAYNYIINELGHHNAPPRYERKINIQEVETILCKWKSHLGGHYEVGKDTHEIREGLLRFAKCAISQKLLAAGKSGGLW